MGRDTAGPAPDIPEGSISPDVAFRILGMAFNGDRSEFVVRPNSSRAPTQRTVAARRRFGRRRQRQAHRAAVAGAV